MPDGPPPRRIVARRSPARDLAAAFALLGLLAVAALARLTPPFQNPDELAHLLRVEQVAGGGLVGTRFLPSWPGARETAGGALDGGAEALYRVFEPLIFRPDHRATQEEFDRAAPLAWGGPARPQSFANTAIYPPVLYLPAAAAVALGRAGGLGVAHTLRLARLAQGMAAVALGTLAVALAGEAAPLLFALLCLPMSLSLMASVSQDAVLLPVAALGAALLLRARRPAMPFQAGGPGTGMLAPGGAVVAGTEHPSAARPGRALAGAGVCLALVAAARPAYLPLAALPLLGPALRPRPRVLVALCVAAAVLAWSGVAAHEALTNLSDGGLADPQAQLALLLRHPLGVAHVALGTLNTHGQRLVESFLGRLGWLDLPLPRWERQVALASLVLALLCAAAPRGPRGARSLALLLGVAAVGAVFALQYLTWTPVGGPIVEGVQGRYFLPLALLLAPCLPVRPLLGRVAGPLATVALPGLAAVTLAATLWEVVARYYLR